MQCGIVVFVRGHAFEKIPGEGARCDWGIFTEGNPNPVTCAAAAVVYAPISRLLTCMDHVEELLWMYEQYNS